MWALRVVPNSLKGDSVDPLALGLDSFFALWIPVPCSHPTPKDVGASHEREATMLLH